MGTCRACDQRAAAISDTIGYCAACIQMQFKALWPQIERVHLRTRRLFDLPGAPPRSPAGSTCDQCMQACRMADGERGYCGIRYADRGRIKGGRPHEGRLSYYADPLPTNCVGSFTCPAGTGSGYPEFAAVQGPEHGFQNLAVFYRACSFNCLYCQNFHFKEQPQTFKPVTSRQLADAVDDRTTCICFFGGDPAPQVLHAVKTARLALKGAQGRILRICWETNGAVQRRYLKMIADLSLHSGGCIKFDLKAWDDRIHLALCGVSNRHTLDNFKYLSRWVGRRADPPLLIASTLLVPGYIDAEEVFGIARFIARQDPTIPYSLLGFYPQFYLDDLAPTSVDHAERCLEAAHEAGLRNVHVGNWHLLGQPH